MTWYVMQRAGKIDPSQGAFRAPPGEGDWVAISDEDWKALKPPPETEPNWDGVKGALALDESYQNWIRSCPDALAVMRLEQAAIVGTETWHLVCQYWNAVVRAIPTENRPSVEAIEQWNVIFEDNGLPLTLDPEGIMQVKAINTLN